MRFVGLIFLTCMWGPASAQDFQQEINEQVWKPFLKASNEFDGPRFMSVQSPEVVQASLGSGRVLDYTAYAHSILPNFERIQREGKVKRTTEMRFTARLANTQMAYERGYFKSTVVRANGETRISYSEFYMTLRKENGIWKILVDADSSLQGTITEEMFLAGTPME